MRFSDIDLMQHMNNAAYVDALDNAAWEAYLKAGLRPDTATITALAYDIEYVESARQVICWRSRAGSTVAKT